MTGKIYRIICKGYPMLEKFPVKILDIKGPADNGIAEVEIISHNRINRTLPNWHTPNKYAHGGYKYHFEPNELTGFRFKILYNSLYPD